MTTRKPKNRKRRTPIPGLAEHIASFTGPATLKSEIAAIRAAFADRVYALSTRERRSYDH